MSGMEVVDGACICQKAAEGDTRTPCSTSQGDSSNKFDGDILSDGRHDSTPEAQEWHLPAGEEAPAEEEPAEARERRLSVWRQVMAAASGDVEAICGISAEDVRALAQDGMACHPCCLVGPIEPDDSSYLVVHASRGMQALTGYNTAFACGKALLDWLAMEPRMINKFMNQEAEAAFLGFCHDVSKDGPKASMTSLFLHQRITGQRFWNLFRALKVEAGTCKYVVIVMGELHLRPPAVLRDAHESSYVAVIKHEKEKWTESEECQDMDLGSFSSLVTDIKVFLRQIRSALSKDVSSLEIMQASTTKSLLSYMKSHTSEFEGDHYVPVIGEAAAVLFEREVKWVGILKRVRNSLYQLYEVSETKAEVVACAVSDPDAEDCPLVYISSEFEKLTGYARHFSIGRNCRFLQPNHANRNQAFNSGELLMMREFCANAKPEYTRIINLLVNEHREGFPFWNLLMMEHIKVKVEPEHNNGREWRNYIFGVQTNLVEPASKLCEMLAMDPSGLAELTRLRHVLRDHEHALGNTTMQGYAKMCFEIWASEFPLHMDMPRFKVLRRDVAKRVAEGIPVVGMELTHETIMDHFGAGLLDGVRHFYLTFSSKSGVSKDGRIDKMEVELLTLKLNQMLTSLKPKFLHYLRMGLTFTLITPPNLVKHASGLLKSGAGYSFSGWLLDLRSVSADRDPCASDEFVGCWKSMSQACSCGLVQYLGICGSAYDLQLFDRACARLSKLSASDAAGSLCPISLMGFDINPTLHSSHLVSLTKLRCNVSVVAFKPGGAQNYLRSTEPVMYLAEECSVDPDFILMKWASLMSDGICMPPVGLSSNVMQGFMRSSMRTQVMKSQQEKMGSRPSTAQAWMDLGAEEAVVHRGLVGSFNKVRVEKVRALPALLDTSNKIPGFAMTLSTWQGVTSPTSIAMPEGNRVRSARQRSGGSTSPHSMSPSAHPLAMGTSPKSARERRFSDVPADAETSASVQMGFTASSLVTPRLSGSHQRRSLNASTRIQENHPEPTSPKEINRNFVPVPPDRSLTQRSARARPSRDKVSSTGSQQTLSPLARQASEQLIKKEPTRAALPRQATAPSMQTTELSDLLGMVCVPPQQKACIADAAGQHANQRMVTFRSEDSFQQCQSEPSSVQGPEGRESSGMPQSSELQDQQTSQPLPEPGEAQRAIRLKRDNVGRAPKDDNLHLVMGA